MTEELFHEHIYLLQSLVLRNFVALPESNQLDIVDRAAKLIGDHTFRRSYANQLVNMLSALKGLQVLSVYVRGVIEDYLDSWEPGLIVEAKVRG